MDFIGFTPAGRRWSSPPLVLQIMALLLGGLVVAQLVTLVLTLLLPPEPQPRYELDDIARTLRADDRSRHGARPLQRVVQGGPPELVGPGWLTSDRSRHELAVLLGRPDDDVQLFFFTPLPFAGTAPKPPRGAALDGARESMRTAAYHPDRADGSTRPVDYLVAQLGRPGGSSGGPGGGGPASPDGIGLRSPMNGNPGSRASPGAQAPSSNGSTSGIVGPPERTEGFPTRSDRSLVAPRDMRSPGLRVESPEVGSRSVPIGDGHDEASVMPGPSMAGPATTTTPGAAPRKSVERPSTPVRNETSTSARVAPPQKSTATVVTAAPIAVATAPRGLFGLAPAPFVEGDFVAAMRSGDGWVVVQPVPEPFPNSWQRRVLLWFVVAFALIAPLGWLFSRRLVRPISGFAVAAEQLGRDPTAAILAIEGPAEVGRAAHAFNRMQSRLRSFVDDRTAMIGAISHDLRTPLTRLRFRIEDVDGALRDGMLHEVDEMEQMITSVLAFIRDASEPGSRERLDLSSIVEDVVEDAVFVGNDVKLTLNEKAPVEVDAIGMRRLFANLVENAVKYGDHARVRLFTDRHDAVTEVSDDGPGLPDDELERVFQPFYRAATARASGKQGSGLGLAVCRSIARAHGGDIRLSRGERGLIAQVRLPLAYGR